LIAIAGWPYRRERGLGTGMKEGLTLFRLGCALATGVVLLCIVHGWKGVLLLVAGVAFAWLAGWYVTRRIGGLTGDVYGALIEGVETVTLLLLLLLEGR
jgi:adenosylcobinamide-GDP ribazoletransferase